MAKLALKIIKSKDFVVGKDKHQHHTCAYKGRVFSVSTLRFEKSDITVAKGIVTINVDVEAVKQIGVNAETGVEQVYLSLVPKLDIDIALF